MNLTLKIMLASVALLHTAWGAVAAKDSVDPPSVVTKWTTPTDYPKIIDINFSDEMWPGETWTGKTGADSPAIGDGGYVNTVVEVPVNGSSGVTYPVMFHNCTFANKRATGALPEQRQPSVASIISDKAQRARATNMPTTGQPKGTRHIWRTT